MAHSIDPAAGHLPLEETDRLWLILSPTWRTRARCLDHSKRQITHERRHLRCSAACWEAPGSPLWLAVLLGQKLSRPKTGLIRAGLDIDRPSATAARVPPARTAVMPGAGRQGRVGATRDAPHLALRPCQAMAAASRGGAAGPAARGPWCDGGGERKGTAAAEDLRSP